jgi:gluconate:H+ symporter, GntP family
MTAEPSHPETSRRALAVLTPHDMTVLLAAAAAILLVIVLISWLKWHPFLALMTCALSLGLAAGLPVAQLLASFGKGFGDTLANVGTVLALGAMFGALLGASRGADRIAGVLVGGGGLRRVPWTMALLAMVLGLPMFFESGLVMMMPVIVSVALRLQADPDRDPAASPYLLAGLPALAGLSVLHGLVPPHPGPLVAIAALHADLGLTLALGTLVAVPTVILAGPLFGTWVSKRARAQPPAQVVASASPADDRPLPGTALTLGTMLFPIVLMLAKSGASLGLPAGSPWRAAADFLGAPVVALLLGTLLAMVAFRGSLRRAGADLQTLLANSLPPMAAVMLVIGAGGAFKQVLIDLGLGLTLGRAGSGRQPPSRAGWASCAARSRHARA